MYVPIHLHSHFSMLDGLSKPKDIVSRTIEIGSKYCALTDHGNIAGMIEFHEECKKEKIIPICGCELYISPKHATIKDETNKKHQHLVVLSKNKNGWNKLIKTVSSSNHPDNFYYKPRLSLAQLGECINGSDIISFSGHLGSTLSVALWESEDKLYDDWEQRGLDSIKIHQDIFGKDNFFLEGQLIVGPKVKKVVDNYNCIKRLSELTGIPVVATADSHYASREDAEDHRILLCSSLKTTMVELSYKLSRHEPIPLEAFFKERNFHLPSEEEMLAIHPKEEVDMTAAIADMCEQYSVTGKPQLPFFSCPGNMTPKDYLTQLCRDGWAEKIKNKIVDREKINEYTNRVKYELDTIFGAGLESYFLVVQDYIAASKNRGELVGIGRGSSAGSLVSYLLGITGIDPIPYGLLFERFYNAGRNTKDNIAFPDIDTDFEITKRDNVISYIRDKYGADKTANIITFGKIKGKSALKEVIRAYGNMSFAEMNDLTKNIPDEAAIADELQEMIDAGEESSIIRWALENNPKDFDGYCQIGDDGKLEGQYSKLFEQAIRLEGTNRSSGKHASGYVISRNPLSECCPMVYDTKSKQQICGWEYTKLEKTGILKFDILGVAILDKIQYIGELLKDV